MITSLLFVALTSSALANPVPSSCAPDVVVDDFTKARFNSWGQRINMLNGFMGNDDKSNIWVNESSSRLQFTTGYNANSFFYTKFVSFISIENHPPNFF
jgi:hypothetical protein